MSESIRQAAGQRSLPEPDTARVEGEIRTAFPEAELPARSYERLIAEMTNHPKDRHVLAAAVVAKAAIIVSDDRKGFPRAACEPRGVRRLSAEEFLLDLLAGHEAQFIAGLELMAGVRRRPPNTVPAIIEALAERRPSLARALRSAFGRVRG